jgi:hypothetical protein
MILACELAINDGAHVPFNAGMVAMLRAAFPHEQLFFAGAPEHVAAVKTQVGSSLADTVAWIDIPAPGRGLGYGGRLVREVKILRGLLRMLTRESLLLLTSCYPSTIAAAKLLERFDTRGVRFQAVLHGGLSGVNGARFRHPIRRLQDMKSALTMFRGSGIQYLVLEDSVRRALVRSLPSLAGRVALLEHPLPPNEEPAADSRLTTPVRFGFLGAATEFKGFPAFTRIASAMVRRHGDRVQFHAIGRLDGDACTLQGFDALATKPAARRLSRGEFVRGVSQLHFIMLLHSPEHYEMNSTGTLLDAMAWQKPVIARRMAMFESLFHAYGDIGYLFSTEQELEALVARIVVCGDDERYQRQVANLRRARETRTPQALAGAYRRIRSGDEGGGPLAYQDAAAR